MKLFFVISVLTIQLCIAAPVKDESHSEIVNSENESDGKGNYRFSFETSNGIRRSETGSLINEGQKNEYIKVEGYYSYTDVDGSIVQIKYTADENGFQIIEVPTVVGQAPVPPAVVATLLGG